LAKVTAYAGSVAGTDPKFIPLPTTWFNQERWLDDVEEARSVDFTQMDKEQVKALLRKHTQVGKIDLDWSWDRMVARLQVYYDEGGFEL